MTLDWSFLLPLIFASLMGVAILVYVVLDGFDLGIGILFTLAEDEDKDTMVNAIGPFWDANETALASLAQGYMLGVYVLGLDTGLPAIGFGLLTAICLTAAYAAMGAAWLIYKSEGELQRKAVLWLRGALVLTALGMAAVSLATPLASPRIFERWFVWPEMLWLSPLPILSALFFLWLWRETFHLPKAGDRHALRPFLTLAAIFTLGFAGLAWSFYPFVVPDRLTIWDAASAPGSLGIILVGTALVLPIMIGASFYVYSVFSGKATDLTYD